MIEIARRTNLQSLSFHCTNITDVAMIQIARHCTSLTTLSISGSHSITDSSVIEIAKTDVLVFAFLLLVQLK